MAKRIIIHMGVHKSGTTSLQNFLRRNKALLEQHMQVTTPGPRSIARRMGIAAWRFSSGRISHAKLRSEFEDACAQMLESPGDVILLSHENLCGAMPGTERDQFALYPHVDAVMAEIDSACAPLSVEYVFYLRDMVKWKSSVHNQVVKLNGYPDPFQTFLAATKGYGDWDEFKTRLNTPRRSVSFFNVEDEPDSTRPGQQLLRHAGLDADMISALEPLDSNRNESLTPGALEFMRLANGLDLARSTRHELAASVANNQPLFDDLTTVLAASRKAH